MKFRNLTLLAALAGALVLTGCDDSDSSNGGGGGGTGTLTGVVTAMEDTAPAGAGTPVGAALDGVEVTATGANGETATATTKADGSYKLNIKGLTAPIILSVTDGDTDYVAVVYALGGTANINGLTTIATFIAFNTGDLDTLVADWADDYAGEVDPDDLTEALKKVNANLAALFDEYELDNTTFNPLTGDFNSDYSDLLDALDCTVSFGPLSINCNDTAFNLSISTAGIFPFGDLGFEVPAGSTWTYTISGKFNGATIPTQNIGDVAGAAVPITTGGFSNIGAAFAGTGYPGGSIAIDSFVINSQGSGAVGSKVIGTMKGTITVDGVLTDAPFNYVFTWTLKTLPAE